MDKSSWNRVKTPKQAKGGKRGFMDSVANRYAGCKREKRKKASIPLGYAESRPSSAPKKRGWRGAAPYQLRHLIVTKKAAGPNNRAVAQGHLRAGALVLPCAIGTSGFSRDKREGDGATPAGVWPILGGFYRPDRMPRPKAWRPLELLRQDMGWCDAPHAPSYNRLVRLPFSSGHELMWRDDGLYDAVLVLGYNIYPRRGNRGSAIFLHCAREGFLPTAGCIALQKADLLRLLPRLASKTLLIVR